MALVAVHIGLQLRFKRRHGLAACHQVSDLLSGLFTFAEISSDGTADQHSEMITDGHRVHDLMRDENNRQTALFGLVDDAQDMRQPATTQ